MKSFRSSQEVTQFGAKPSENPTEQSLGEGIDSSSRRGSLRERERERDKDRQRDGEGSREMDTYTHTHTHIS